MNLSDFTQAIQNHLNITKLTQSVFLKKISFYQKEDNFLNTALLFHLVTQCTDKKFKKFAFEHIGELYPEIHIYDKRYINFVNHTSEKGNQIDILLSYRLSLQELEYFGVKMLFKDTHRRNTLLTLWMFLGYQRQSKYAKHSETILDFYFLNHKDEYVSDILIRIFRDFAESSLLDTIVKYTCLGAILNRFLEYGHQATMLSLYWCYNYPNSTKISEIIFNFLIDSAGFTPIDFTMQMLPRFSMGNISYDKIKERYALLQSDPAKGKSRLSAQKDMLFVIPLCVYVKHLGDIETEVIVLRELVKKTGNNVFLLRLAEISQSTIDKTLMLNIGRNIGGWLLKMEQECVGITTSRHAHTPISAKRLKRCREYYMFNPFGRSVVRAMYCIALRNNNEVFYAQFLYSLQRITRTDIFFEIVTSMIHLETVKGLDQIRDRIHEIGSPLLPGESLFAAIRKKYQIFLSRDQVCPDFFKDIVNFCYTYTDRSTEDEYVWRDIFVFCNETPYR